MSAWKVQDLEGSSRASKTGSQAKEWNLCFFGSAKPLGFEAGDANLYRYVKNGPVDLRDPSGLAPVPENRWPSWLRALIGVEGATGGRGIIRTITSVNQDFSHVPGGGGMAVPAHYDVNYIDENGQPRFQRFQRDARSDGSRAFTDEQHTAMQQNRNTERARRRSRRNSDRGNAFGILGVYLTIRDAVEAAGVGGLGYHVAEEVPYFFTQEDGSVFRLEYYLWPRSLVSNSRRVYVAGPRRGETEVITNTQVDELIQEGRRLYGVYTPGTLFRDPQFTPGILRRRLELIDDYTGDRIGYIDESGPHRYPAPRPRVR